MPRQTTRLAAVRGRVARVTKTDFCGRVVAGEYNQAVSDGVITAAFTANTTETEAVDVKNFAGRRCVYEPAVTELAGYSLTLTFCNVDFELFEIITNQTLVFDAQGRVRGIEVDTQIPLNGDGFALEIFPGSAEGDACEDEDAEGEFGYLLLPLLKGGIVGDFSVENGAVNFTITGASTREGNQWGNGPYAVEMDADGNPAPLFQPVSRTAALRMMITTVTPPVDTVGARPVLNPALPAFTSLAVAGVDLEADFTPAPASTGPVWYDFGDGEWDYVVAPGTASHEYAAAGTYTALASQNGLDWESVEVVVPFP
jgi:hypothetical protein